ncbi:MAG: adenylate/guanylate cyclase domain-containing protein [Burkholderiales bacterium]|nr:adenylate/guanylate cyclase domain-containing protein [Burkholderiales bacterium]
MSIRLKIIFAMFLVTVAIALSATGTSYWLLQTNLAEDFRHRLADIAHLGAASIDVPATQRLIGQMAPTLSETQVEKIEQSDDYKLIDRQLQTIREAEPTLIKYVYIMTPSADANGSRFLVDADVHKLVAKKKRGEKVEEEISHFGLKYDIPERSLIKKAFKDNALTVEKEFTPDPKYLTNSLSAYAPIRDEQGRLLGILGVDLSDKNMLAALRQSKLASGVIVVLALLLATLLSIFVGIQLTRGIKLLDSVVRRFAMKEFDVRAPVVPADEVGNLGKSFNSMAQTIDNHSKHLETLLKAYGRFVPHSFLDFLKKDSVIDLRLGDHVQQEMTVLFSDIRSFTTFSEEMTPQDNFDFINAFLKRVGPIIRNRNGVIDKYIGDAVMALFATSPADAVAAGIDMQRKVAEYNLNRVAKGWKPIAIGVGLHTGNLILGTVGEDERMNSTVIADAVNLASRLESITKYYGVGIVVSGDTLTKLAHPESFKTRFLDKIQVKGKNDYVVIHEVFDADDDTTRAAKEEILPSWQSAVDLYFAKRFSDAAAMFQAVLQRLPDDKVAQIYLERINQLLANGLPPNWTGVEVMHSK